MTLPFFRPMLHWIVATCFFATILHAQSGTTSLSGRVLDPDGAEVPHAKIFVVNKARAVRREVTTGLGGFFTVDQLPPLNYAVRVEKDGFVPVEFETVTLNVSGPNKLTDIELKVAQLSSTSSSWITSRSMAAASSRLSSYRPVSLFIRRPLPRKDNSAPTVSVRAVTTSQSTELARILHP
jgi:Carboxypeptidase regulatory-like domain